jgi:hypothetical protein
VLIIWLLQQHVVAICYLADTTLEVVCSISHYVWPGVAGSSNDEEPNWQDLFVDPVD